MTQRELRRLEIDELLEYAQRGENERIEAALELLRRKEAKNLRKQSARSRGPSAGTNQPVALGTGSDT